MRNRFNILDETGFLTFQRWGNSQLGPPYDGVVSPNDRIVPHMQ